MMKASLGIAILALLGQISAVDLKSSLATMHKGDPVPIALRLA